MAARWILSHADHLHEDSRLALKKLLDLSPELAATAAHVRGFATLMNDRDGGRLPEWIDAARADSDSGLRTFATGLHADLDAVIYGLTTWSAIEVWACWPGGSAGG
jgi:hypothetical protein